MYLKLIKKNQKITTCNYLVGLEKHWDLDQLCPKSFIDVAMHSFNMRSKKPFHYRETLASNTLPQLTWLVIKK